MIRKLSILACLLFLGSLGHSQEVEFTEFDLENGLHVILHQDNSVPIITTSVMYDVGGKDRMNNKSGFAHFFEHLLFEGTKNIPKGQWDKIISSHGGSHNAYTTNDETYYYEVLPSNNLELALWMESERMLHPVINQKGVDTQNEVVKEEKRLRMDNRPYGKALDALSSNLFEKHPYKISTIGTMEDLDAATLDEFYAYFKKFYAPNNAVLVIAGDIELNETKELVKKYFSEIPAGKPVTRNFPKESPITETKEATAYDANIQLPALIVAYRTPPMTNKDSYILDMIATYLSDGNSSKLYKKLVDDQKQALAVQSFNLGQVDYGLYGVFAIPLGETDLNTLEEEIEEEIAKIRSELISEKDLQKLKNKAENDFVRSNSSIEGIANSLAKYYLLYDNTDLINEEIEIYRSISREDIQRVAREYLKPNQRVIIDYLPKKTETE